MRTGYAVPKPERWLVAAMATRDTRARMLMRARVSLHCSGFRGSAEAEAVAVLVRKRLRALGELKRGEVR